jgi:hypothetical protein
MKMENYYFLFHDLKNDIFSVYSALKSFPFHMDFFNALHRWDFWFVHFFGGLD